MIRFPSPAMLIVQPSRAVFSALLGGVMRYTALHHASRRRGSWLLLALLLGGGGQLQAQGSTVPAPARQQIQAVRLAWPPPLIDGRLDDAAWQHAPALTDLVQRQPEEGAPATERTEVRFLFDETALYIGARMYSDDPSAIQAPISRRDQGAQAERLLVSLDTYLDRRTAHTFGVTASGVRLDWYHPADREASVDLTFDPVWEARTEVDSLGWTAEMRIPFSQLRFSRQVEQVWGLNVARVIPSRNEVVYWVLVPQRETGWASRFGELTGISGIRAARRVELLPYVASSATYTGTPDPGNPFLDVSAYKLRAGGDVKMGLGPNLTLEATVNPDFGQVEADPAEVNLSAFETFFPERRPFFREGSQLLRGDGPTYFYSRRIGAQPRGSASADYVDFPNTSTILGAGKITGRLASGTSIGMLGAVTNREYARTFHLEGGEFGRVLVAPLTGQAVVRTQQEWQCTGDRCTGLRHPSATRVGLSLTGVRRDVTAGDPLSELLHRQAFTGGGDWSLRFNRGEYELSGHAGFSYVEGDSSALRRTQRSSARYFQRPDADHLTLSPSRTSLAGYAAGLNLERASGRNWLWFTSLTARSPGFELNDLGALGRADQFFGYGNLRYRETQPGPLFRDYEIGVSTENAFNFGGTRTWGALRTDSEVTWPNFWRTLFTAWVDLRAQSDRATRGGPLMGTGQAWAATLDVFNSTAARTRLQGRIYYGESELGEQTYRLTSSVSIRPSPRWQLSLAPGYVRSTDPRQYVLTRGGGPAETFGQRYVFSFIDRSELSSQLRLNYTVTPDLSLEVYAEPFAASGRFYDFGELAAARSRDLRFYGTDGSTLESQPNGSLRVTDGTETFSIANRDFNIRSFRSNAVLRWEWRPGSTLFLVWQQDRFGEERHGRLVGPGALWETLEARGDNFLAIKATYWLGR
jgi:hypothetical protein